MKLCSLIIVPLLLGFGISVSALSIGKPQHLGTVGLTYLMRAAAAVSALPVGCISSVVIQHPAKAGYEQSFDGYTITDLGTLGGDQSYALAINRAGEIVGEAETHSGRTHAFIWRKGKMHDLGAPGQNYSTQAIWANDKGQVVGNSSEVASERGGGVDTVIWNKGKIGEITDGNGRSWVFVDRINNSGVAVGSTEIGPASWLRGKTTQLQTLGGKYAHATSLNDRGQIVGWSETKAGETHAVLWERGKLTDLGTLGGSYSRAADIDLDGRIVGESTVNVGPPISQPMHLFRWYKGKAEDLGDLGLHGAVVATNARGQILFTRRDEKNGTHSCLYDKGKIIDLTELISKSMDWGLMAVSSLNDAGQIVGAGTRDDVGHAFLLSPRRE